MKVYTLTLNPAFDIHAYTDELICGSENLLKINSKSAGGKGVNISRALDKAGVNNKAMIVLGNENSDEFTRILNIKSAHYFIKDGRIRENITVHTSSDETRISFEGFELNDNIFDEILSVLNIGADDILTFTGSIPKGISKSAVLNFLNSLKKRGIRLVIDSKSITLNDLYKIRPWLIKPNEEEISAYFNTQIKDLDTAALYAEKIYSEGIQNVMISLGGSGAVLLCADGVFKAVPPKIKVVSTIGAGDSMIAGFIFGFTKGISKEKQLKLAVSFGTAACLTEGTAPPELDKIFNISEQIK